MVNVTVDAGICGFISIIKAHALDEQTVEVSIESKCDAVAALANEIKNVDAFSVVFAKYGVSPVYQAADKHFKHAACPVPCAIVKAIEAAAALALPKDVVINIEKTG